MCNNSLLATDYIEKIFSRKSKQTSAMKPEVKGGVICRIYSRFLHVGIPPHPAFSGGISGWLRGLSIGLSITFGTRVLRQW